MESGRESGRRGDRASSRALWRNHDWTDQEGSEAESRGNGSYRQAGASRSGNDGTGRSTREKEESGGQGRGNQSHSLSGGGGEGIREVVVQKRDEKGGRWREEGEAELVVG